MNRRRFLTRLGFVGAMAPAMVGGLPGKAPKRRPSPSEGYETSLLIRVHRSEMRFYETGIEFWRDGEMLSFIDEQGVCGLGGEA